jgi:hypothetical protein
MKTLITELIDYLKIRNEGIANVLSTRFLSNYERDRYNGMYDFNESLILELETEYLHREKQRIETAFDFGKNLNYLKTSEEFFNEMYKI